MRVPHSRLAPHAPPWEVLPENPFIWCGTPKQQARLDALKCFGFGPSKTGAVRSGQMPLFPNNPDWYLRHGYDIPIYVRRMEEAGWKRGRNGEYVRPKGWDRDAYAIKTLEREIARGEPAYCAGGEKRREERLQTIKRRVAERQGGGGRELPPPHGQAGRGGPPAGRGRGGRGGHGPPPPSHPGGFGHAAPQGFPAGRGGGRGSGRGRGHGTMPGPPPPPYQTHMDGPEEFGDEDDEYYGSYGEEEDDRFDDEEDDGAGPAFPPPGMPRGGMGGRGRGGRGRGRGAMRGGPNFFH